MSSPFPLKPLERPRGGPLPQIPKLIRTRGPRFIPNDLACVSSWWIRYADSLAHLAKLAGNRQATPGTSSRHFSKDLTAERRRARRGGGEKSDSGTLLAKVSYYDLAALNLTPDAA